MTNASIIKKLNACRTGLDRARESATLREWWGTSTTISDMTWLIGQAHSVGALSRRRLVGVSLRCVATVAHLMPPKCLPLLADLTAWCAGDDSIDLAATSDLLWGITSATYAATYAAAYDAAAYAAAYAATYAAAYAAAAYAATDAAYDAAYAAAMCDVIRDSITIDEVCAALGLNPDQGVDA